MQLKIIPILTALGLSVGALFARELKEFDNNVNYDEEAKAKENEKKVKW